MSCFNATPVFTAVQNGTNYIGIDKQFQPVGLEVKLIEGDIDSYNTALDILRKQPNKILASGWAALFYAAVKQNDTDTVKNIMRNHHDLYTDLVDSSGRSAMHVVAERGDLKLARKLSDYININVLDHEQFTPLMRAAQNGHFEIVRLLLDSSRINLDTRQANYVIQNLSANESDIMNDILKRMHPIGFTLLQSAAAEGDDRAVKALLDDDRNSYLTVADISLALIFAGNRERWSTVKLLLQHDHTHVDYTNEHVRAVFDLAVKNNQLDVLECFMQKNPNYHFRDNEGRSLLDLAIAAVKMN